MNERDGVTLIAAERQRQIDSEGWTPEHDDEHQQGELALVAALFAAPVPLFLSTLEDPWPEAWSRRWDKRPTGDRIDLLVKAGALIAAELDRLQRAMLKAEKGGDNGSDA